MRSYLVLPTARAVIAASAAELWPDKVDVRDFYGHLWKVITKSKAHELVASGVAEAIGRPTVRYVRLKCSLSSGRNDASRFTQRLQVDLPVARHKIEPRRIQQ